MGRTVSFVLDDKAVDVEREKLLDLEDPLQFSEKQDFTEKLESASSISPLGLLPSLKDIVKTVLFCGVTVFGISLFSNAIPIIGWHNKPQFGHNEENRINRPIVVDSCPTSAYNTSLSMDFTDPKKFSFTQTSQEFLSRRDQSFDLVRTTGSIEVRTSDNAFGSYIHVDLDIHGSDSRLTNSQALGIAKTDSTLLIKTPKQLSKDLTSGALTDGPCLHVSTIITLASGASLENLGIKSESIPVIFRPGLDYAESRVVETKTHFDSMSSYSRETVIDVSSASVTGSFPLYDLLSIYTNSGSVDVEIVPKKASRQSVKPAVLRLSSNSGSVRARTSTVSVPDRDYQTSISTSSGSIEVEVLHGLRTSLRSINGRISAHLHPYGHNDSKTSIEVHATRSSLDVTLHPSISHPTASLKKLYGYYRSVSGSLTLFYPAQWQGTVEGTTLSGGVDLDWKGLKIIRDGKYGHLSRSIEAVHGEGEGKLEFHASSGRVHLSGGESGGP